MDRMGNELNHFAQSQIPNESMMYKKIGFSIRPSDAAGTGKTVDPSSHSQTSN